MLKYKLRRINRHHAILLTVLLTAIFTSCGFALTASNTFPSGGGHAGDGAGTVAGYTISNVSYTLSSSDPTKVTSWTITFSGTVPGAGAHVYSRVLDSGGNGLPSNPGWVTCSGAGATWTCTPSSQPSTSAIVNVEVSAAE